MDLSPVARLWYNSLLRGGCKSDPPSISGAGSSPGLCQQSGSDCDPVSSNRTFGWTARRISLGAAAETGSSPDGSIAGGQELRACKRLGNLNAVMRNDLGYFAVGVELHVL